MSDKFTRLNIFNSTSVFDNGNTGDYETKCQNLNEESDIKYELNSTQKQNRCSKILNSIELKSLQFVPNKKKKQSNDRFKNQAKHRREKENIEYNLLSKLIPLPSAITNQLDKASIIRLSTCFLKLRMLFNHSEKPTTSSIYENHILQHLNGFLIIMDKVGKIQYISESASTHLGLSQVDMTGNSIFEFLCPDDQYMIVNVLNQTPFLYPRGINDQTILPDEMKIQIDSRKRSLYKTEKKPFNLCSSIYKKQIFVRLRCVLAKRNASITVGGYKVIRMLISTVISEESENFVIFAQSIPQTISTEITVKSHMFVVRLDNVFNITFADSNLVKMTGYDQRELMHKSLYDVCHICDVEILREAHEILIQTGQTVSRYYRFINKRGGYIWVMSLISLMVNIRANTTQLYVCLNYILSEVESPNVKFNILKKKKEIPDIFTISHKKYKYRNEEYSPICLDKYSGFNKPLQNSHFPNYQNSQNNMYKEFYQMPLNHYTHYPLIGLDYLQQNNLDRATHSSDTIDTYIPADVSIQNTYFFNQNVNNSCKYLKNEQESFHNCCCQYTKQKNHIPDAIHYDTKTILSYPNSNCNIKHSYMNSSVKSKNLPSIYGTSNVSIN
ncbi:Neuronal PAS domain-containing protein 1 [Intoshia linei]|uniref:Neuronal PAS domain-containing protein 1 n=1 Tax=Intoshia linei TaxID=1819745 RepID=A0A177BB05_9BILA|nr:Neuronal PAS domain-containing protein 1 [Intoshia linei]